MSLLTNTFLIFLLMFFSKSAQASGVIDLDCQKRLAPQQTKIIKMAIENPVDLYFELYDRDLKHMAETGSRDFPVSDLFGEDLQSLREKLVWAQKYFQLRKNKAALDTTQKLFARANKMRREGFGFLSYFELSEACIHLFEIMSQDRLYQAEDLPGYPLVKEYVELDKEGAEFTPVQLCFDYISAYLLRAGKTFGLETQRFAIRSYHQFPLYSLPTTSVVDRMELATAISAPLSIRRTATYTETVDGIRFPPLLNAGHDDGHVTRGLQILLSDRYVKRFANRDELRTHLLEKESATKYIVHKIKQVEDPKDQLLFDRMVFTYTHEKAAGSIEYFGTNYFQAIYVKPEREHKFYIVASTNFLSLEDSAAPPREEEEKLVKYYKTLQQWYVEGGGPKHQPLSEGKK